MDPIITNKRATESNNNADGGQQQPPAPLLDSPLPTPRRSCASVDALLRARCRRAASPLRTKVPFSWESSPGVPKTNSNACSRNDDDVRKKASQAQAAMMMPPPKPRPPPGRQQPYLARNVYYGNTSEASSDEDDDRSFSDALDRISSPERERTGSFDRVTSKRFEDIFVGRTTSFAAKDRTGTGTRTRHPATDLSSSASGRHRPRQPRRRGRGHHDDEDGRGWTPRILNDSSVPMQLMQRIKMDADAEEMTPRACGLMVFFPWSAKPAVCGFRNPAAAAQHATTTTTTMTRARADVPSPSSHSRRVTTTTTTLRDVIKAENNEAIISSDMLPPQPRGEKKRGRDHRDELPSPSRRWGGVSSLLDTSKKYCTDARKALSKLSIGLGADGGGDSPRVSSENRRSGKLNGGFASSTPATPAKSTQLKANRN